MKSDQNFKFPMLDTVLSAAVIGAIGTMICYIAFSPELLHALA